MGGKSRLWTYLQRELLSQDFLLHPLKASLQKGHVLMKLVAKSLKKRRTQRNQPREDDQTHHLTQLGGMC